MRKLNSRTIKSFALLLGFMLHLNVIQAQDAAKLFKANCASCHKPSDQKLVGPGLKGVRGRGNWSDNAKLTAWVKNSVAYLSTGDAYANKLFEEYGKSVMPAQNLSDAEIIAIIDWADKGGDAPAATTAQADGANKGAANGDSGTNYSLILIVVAVILLILVTVLNSVKKSLEALVNEKKGIETIEKPNYGNWGNFKVWAANNKKIVAVLGLLVVVWVLKQGWDGLMGIGVYQGYAPEQPIKFSHKLHAGDNKIACVYCHSGVEKSKHANIPSANVCMNCHMYIQEGPQYGKEEISKIYAALDYNPETRQYGNNKKPIQWIRVHSLPDHAYFNHSQHVAVGKIECTECHGAIDSMEVVKQHAPLTMGWCIDCHRKTEVDFKDNKYYEELHKEFVNDPKYKKGDKFTIGSIGGLECSKCHY
ncbi:MAG: c-type cytochrome [Bacteroidia bacterium]